MYSVTILNKSLDMLQDDVKNHPLILEYIELDRRFNAVSAGYIKSAYCLDEDAIMIVEKYDEINVQFSQAVKNFPLGNLESFLNEIQNIYAKMDDILGQIERNKLAHR